MGRLSESVSAGRAGGLPGFLRISLLRAGGVTDVSRGTQRWEIRCGCQVTGCRDTAGEWELFLSRSGPLALRGRAVGCCGRNILLLSCPVRLSPIVHLFNFFFHYCIYFGGWERCTPWWRPVDNMEESVSSFYHEGLGTRTQVIRHNNKRSYLLNHLTSPILLFLMSSSKPQDFWYLCP